ncbi:MAG TPA: hypothetical protein VGD53_20195 [Actinoallomurus sp.]|jgi:hypothetical protein
MLTKLSPAISIAILAAGATVALGTTPASAGGGPGTKPGGVINRLTTTTPGRRATPGGHGGGGRAGKPAPIPCPAGQVCGALTVGAAPLAAIPTIELAYEARNRLVLPPPTVHTSPPNRTYVQLRTGLWIDPGDFAEETAAAPLPGTTVTAIAKPRDVTWNMGEGTTITCKTAGSRNGRSCGYTYPQSSAGRPGGKYPIIVTVTWDVSWTCTGVCDAPAGDWGPDSTMTKETNTSLAVGEVQTESRPG